MPLFVQPGYAQAGFVYAAVPGPLCPDGTPCTSAVHVYDAATARLVIRLPLPPQTAPVSIAVSRDGAYIYVSSARTIRSQPPQVIEGSMTVIDARHHRLVGTFATGEHAGPIAVSDDGSRVVIASTVTFETDAWKGTLSVVDPVSRTIVQSAGILPGVRHVEISTNPERIVLFGLDPTRFAFAYTSRLTSLDPVTLNVISSDVRQRAVPGGLALSADRQRVHALYQSPFEPPASRRVTFDPTSLAVLSDFAAGTYATAPVELPGGAALLAFDSQNLMRFALRRRRIQRRRGPHGPRLRSDGALRGPARLRGGVRQHPETAAVPCWCRSRPQLRLPRRAHCRQRRAPHQHTAGRPELPIRCRLERAVVSRQWRDQADHSQDDV